MKKEQQSKGNEFKSDIELARKELKEQLGGGGIFGIESIAKEEARKLELRRVGEEIERANQEFNGVNTLLCPKCGEKQSRYKSDRVRKLELDSGTLEMKRGYYHCRNCNHGFFPLDRQLGLTEGTRDQGCLREKLSLIGTLVPYHQSEQVCEILLGRSEEPAKVRRVLMRESECYDKAELDKSGLDTSAKDTLYLQMDGHMCPTRAKKRDENDQGYREAKVAIAFREQDVANVSKNRNEILHQILAGEITSANEFTNIVADVYDRAQGEQAGRVVALGDGAKWIWNIVDEVAPEAIQIIDYSHAKQYLWQAAEIIFGKMSDLRIPWVQQQKALLFEDKVDQVIENIERYGAHEPELSKVATYLRNNKKRLLYGNFRAQGLLIGSGAIESAGKRIAHGRIKGCGMRWNIDDLNKVIHLRCAFFDGSWRKYWRNQKLRLVA